MTKLYGWYLNSSFLLCSFCIEGHSQLSWLKNIICDTFTPVNLMKSVFKMLPQWAKCTQLQHSPCLQLGALTIISHTNTCTHTHSFYWISTTWSLLHLSYGKEHNFLAFLQLWLIINHLHNNFNFYLPLTLWEGIISILLTFLSTLAHVSLKLGIQQVYHEWVTDVTNWIIALLNLMI